ncbi:MAG: cupin domain-containing protein [Patescibacteria group bacterium]|jgi:mannose-6-phosphate isomerase-like protein (cupin superfamily)
MKISHKSETHTNKNSNVCIAVEYPMDDKDINGAVVELTGRYPATGRVTNLECKEMGYVIKGAGKIVIEDAEHALAEGDLVLIEPGEKFYWEGNMTMFMPCTPAWHPEQHKEVE